jgi:CHC2-type zinc finger protein
MTAASKVLDRLTRVKQTGAGRWIALCPAHEDRAPSLSIREMEDGRVLINCFAGCGAGDVLDAIGLRMSDLFDKPIAHHLPPIRGGFSARELLELNAHEATVVALLASDAQTRALTAEEIQRLTQAAERLGKAQAMVNGHR